MDGQCDGKNQGENTSKWQTRKKSMLWTLSLAFLFAFTLAVFYYCTELIRSARNSHLLLEKRVMQLEIEQRDAYKFMLKITNTIQNVTSQFGETRNELPFPGVSRPGYVDNSSRHKREIRKRAKRNASPASGSSGSTESVENLGNQAKALERTIHSFRREMFTLNDRYVITRDIAQNICKEEQLFSNISYYFC